MTTCLVAWAAVEGQEITGNQCSITSFACAGTEDKCIPLAWKCDGNADCTDGSDEDPILCPGEYTKPVTPTPSAPSPCVAAVGGVVTERFKCRTVVQSGAKHKFQYCRIVITTWPLYKFGR